MRACTTVVAAILSCAFAVPVFAGVGSIPDNGTHYTVNLIGVPQGKKVDMTDSQRRTIFVPIDKTGGVTRIQISYVRNTQNPNAFQVLDGNGTDGSAIIAVPYQYCTDAAGCTDLLSYNVYAVALGKPGNGGAVVDASCTYDTDVFTPGGAPTTCTETLAMKSFELKRETGSPKPVDISNIFRASGCLDTNGDHLCSTGDTTFSNVWIFNIPNLLNYYWDYTNTDLKHMQLRFYPSVSGVIGIKQ